MQIVFFNIAKVVPPPSFLSLEVYTEPWDDTPGSPPPPLPKNNGLQQENPPSLPQTCPETTTRDCNTISPPQDPEFPALSLTLRAQIDPSKRAMLPTINNYIFEANREDFFRTKLAPNIQAMIDQPFGKESVNHSFTCLAELRHILLPLFFSQYIAITDHTTWQTFALAYPLVQIMLDLIQEHGDIDFNPLKSYHTFHDETEINPDRAKMATAALLFFQGDAATLIRWIGASHTAEHRVIPPRLFPT
jgi:hypothetical protein